MKKYTLLTSILFLCSTHITIGMETPVSEETIRSVLKNKLPEGVIDILCQTPTTDNEEGIENELKTRVHTFLDTNDEIITFLNRIPVVLENSHNCHSIVSINDDTDEVTIRVCPDSLCTWDMNTGKLKHSEKAPESRAVPFSLRTITYGNIMAELSQEDRSVTLRDINTGECFFKHTESERIINIAMNDKILVTALSNGVIRIRKSNTGLNEIAFQTKGTIKSIALDRDTIIVGFFDGAIQVYDANNYFLLETFTIKNNPHSGPSDVQAVAVRGSMLAACTYTMLKVWKNRNSDNALTIPTTVCSGNRGTQLAIGNQFAVSSSWDDDAKVTRLEPNLDGTPENNPLLWIRHKANSAQFDLIKRAYEATVAQKQLVVTLLENPGIVSLNESQEQKDGRVYPTIAVAVRKYLCDRLNIRVY